MFLNFRKWRIFSNSILFSVKTAFSKISDDFVTGYEKLFFHLKALQTKMLLDENNFFCSSGGSGDIREKHKFQNQLMCFFCYSLYFRMYLKSHFFVTNANSNDWIWPFTGKKKKQVILTLCSFRQNFCHKKSNPL